MPSPDLSLSDPQRRAFALAREAAGRLMQRRVRVYRLAKRGFKKMNAHPEALSKVRDDLSTLLRLARAWARRDYRSIPWKSILYAVAGLVYFVNPVDLIPDALVGIGFVDDVAVLAAVVRALQGDMERFRAWERERPALPEAT